MSIPVYSTEGESDGLRCWRYSSTPGGSKYIYYMIWSFM